jgi:hypothetical protein
LLPISGIPALCDNPQLIKALYQCFNTPLVFPAPDDEQGYVELCAAGLAVADKQGKAIGYRITLLGFKKAEERWGHRQR